MGALNLPPPQFFPHPGAQSRVTSGPSSSSHPVNKEAAPGSGSLLIWASLYMLFSSSLICCISQSEVTPESLPSSTVLGLYFHSLLGILIWMATSPLLNSEHSSAPSPISALSLPSPFLGINTTVLAVWRDGGSVHLPGSYDWASAVGIGPILFVPAAALLFRTPHLSSLRISYSSPNWSLSLHSVPSSVHPPPSDSAHL